MNDTRPIATAAASLRLAAPVHELAAEHGVLLRQIGALQRRCSEQLRAAAAREAALEGDRLRLRAELVRLRTCVVWGLGLAPVPRRPGAAVSARADVATGTHAAQAVICQTGCVGHAHPWLAADGQCRRSGEACERVSDTAAR